MHSQLIIWYHYHNIISVQFVIMQYKELYTVQHIQDLHVVTEKTTRLLKLQLLISGTG